MTLAGGLKSLAAAARAVVVVALPAIAGRPSIRWQVGH